MTKRLILLTFLITNLIHQDNLFGQDVCKTDRYINETFFSKENISFDKNVEYGIAKDWQGVQDTQRFNIAYPKLQSDQIKTRPFILLLHGGGFHIDDYDYRNKNNWNSTCVMLAMRGFVAATADYRVGWNDVNVHWDPKGKLDPTAIKAPYRAYQDIRAALRYFVHNSSTYGIDTNAIFIGGRSAGGDISLSTAYLTEKDLDSLVKKFEVNYVADLGRLDSSTNNITNKYKIRGVINMWGPIPDTAFIDLEEIKSMPIIMFHGTDDTQVPYKKFCPPDYPYTRYGSYYIAERYRLLGGCYELNTKIGGGHGEDFSEEFLADKISVFIKNILCNSCKSGEFESKVSFKSKFMAFVSSDIFKNLALIVFLLLTIFFIVKIIKRRRRKKTGKS